MKRPSFDDCGIGDLEEYLAYTTPDARKEEFRALLYEFVRLPPDSSLETMAVYIGLKYHIGIYLEEDEGICACCRRDMLSTLTYGVCRTCRSHILIYPDSRRPFNILTVESTVESRRSQWIVISNYWSPNLVYYRFLRNGL